MLLLCSDFTLVCICELLHAALHTGASGLRQGVIQSSAGRYFMAGTTSAASLEGAQAAASVVHGHMVLLQLARALCLLKVMPPCVGCGGYMPTCN